MPAMQNTKIPIYFIRKNMKEKNEMKKSLPVYLVLTVIFQRLYSLIFIYFSHIFTGLRTGKFLVLHLSNKIIEVIFLF